MTLLNNFRHFFEYLARPKVPQKVNRVKSLGFLLALFLFSLAVDFFLDYVSSGKYLLNTLQIKNINASSEDIYRKGLVFAIIVTVLITPLIEELIHRYYLTSFIWNIVFYPLRLCLIVIELFHIHDNFFLSIFVGTCLIFSLVMRKVLTKSKKYKNIFLRLQQKFHSIFLHFCNRIWCRAHR